MIKPFGVTGRFSRRHFIGAAAAASLSSPLGALAATPSEHERWLSFRHIHTGQRIKTLYWADGHYILGVVWTQRGEVERADRSFQRASELAPDDFETPFRLAPEAFDRAVEEALGLLPEEFAKYLENVEVGVEEVPTQELLQSGSSFDDLGLYIGASIQWGDSDFPDRILLFQRNLENISPDRETLVEEIRDTVLHEVGHHMGLEEDELPF